MLQQLHDLLVVGAQMVGLGVLACGCLFIAGAVLSGRPGGMVKGGALVLIGGYLAGFGASLH
jgi:hypothetical protein